MRHGGFVLQIAILNQRKRLRGRSLDVGVFWVSPVMGFVTSLSDADFIERRFSNRDRRTVVKTVILGIGILVTAAVIAAFVTFAIEWMRTDYLRPKAKTNQKAGAGSELVRDSQTVNVAVASTAPAAATFLLESPFARASGLLFLPEPVGSEPLRQDQASGFTAVERMSTDLVIGMLFPAGTPSDEYQTKVPLPRSRPLNLMAKQAESNTADSADVAISSTSSSAASSAFTFLERLFHFWQARNEIKLPPEANDHTAVYDIEGHLVYLPNGEKLEAHSGMGKLLDDARYVNEKGRGPTPPNIYHLALRKSLFHGVQAIRLNPVDGSKMYGREGILAHPYMLGPDGQSNGCVSLQDYPKFLEAFQSGKVDRLIVVPKLGDAPSNAANVLGRDEKQYALQ